LSASYLAVIVFVIVDTLVKHRQPLYPTGGNFYTKPNPTIRKCDILPPPKAKPTTQQG